MNNSGQILLLASIYQFPSFSQSLFSNLTDAGFVIIIDTVNKNAKLMIYDDSDTYTSSLVNKML